VKDPVLVEEAMSEEGIYWLNQNFNSEFIRGNRNIYIRRGSTGTRMAGGGDLAQNEEFERFLKAHNFETITFGAGELSVRQQVSLLDGANVILCAHGAALTNIVYLKPPVSIIEVISQMTPRACFMHIASTLGFKYYGVFSTTVDTEYNIHVGRDELEEAMSVLGKA
jgi:capsular polysaccharide biosynthesis protein